MTPILDPRNGDIEDDASSTKKRSMLSLAGSLLAVAAGSPRTQVYGVEPAAGDDGRRSLEQGGIVHMQTPRTIADGAQTLHLGELTFPVIR